MNNSKEIENTGIIYFPQIPQSGNNTEENYNNKILADKLKNKIFSNQTTIEENNKKIPNYNPYNPIPSPQQFLIPKNNQNYANNPHRDFDLIQNLSGLDLNNNTINVNNNLSNSINNSNTDNFGYFSPPMNINFDNKFICNYEIQIENEENFKITKRIIGNKGLFLKTILFDNCGKYGDNSTKIRLRGRGSGFKEGISHNGN